MSRKIIDCAVWGLVGFGFLMLNGAIGVLSFLSDSRAITVCFWLSLCLDIIVTSWGVKAIFQWFKKKGDKK